MSRQNLHKGDGESTRREFAKTLTLMAAAAGTAACPYALTSANEPKPPKLKDAKPESALTAAQALTEVVRLRHGAHLTEEQLKEIQRSLDRSLRSADRLKQVEQRRARFHVQCRLDR